ncbi:MAG: hypothetical protein CVV05_00375 [Gammaproteobacteria bacterium HGW-Gammaproteobacteria-1]|jgi:hypothetical protein|nr:MAG: hypothetical protein CVV05_00375 [Gammaproteobacteria bacterium HGW-Gammaproteobacteria-1]
MRGAPNIFDVLIPIPYSPYGMMILQGSGVIGRRQGDNYVIDYEGNCYGAESLLSFESRVLRAADRASVNYPTAARMAILAPGAFVKVGEYDYASKALVLFDSAPGLRMLREWLGDEPLPQVRRAASDLWRVVQVHAVAANGDAVSLEDHDVPGVYDVEVPGLLWDDATVATAALRRFHGVVPVADTEALQFTVRDGDRELMPAEEDVAEVDVCGGAVSKRNVAT